MKRASATQLQYVMAGIVSVSLGLWSVFAVLYLTSLGDQFNLDFLMIMFIVGNVGAIAWVISNRPHQERQQERR
jgi:hypothetical protein